MTRGITYVPRADRITGERWEEIDVSFPRRVTEVWLRSLTDEELHAVIGAATAEEEAASGFPDYNSRKSARRRVRMALDEHERRRAKTGTEEA